MDHGHGGDFVNTVVLGAGIAGLAYASKAKGSVKVYEKNAAPGGLCGSFVKDGFTFDYGIHQSFTAIPEARKFFDNTDYTCYRPHAANHYHGLVIPNPVIYNLYKFPEDVRTRLIASFRNRTKDATVNNYADWLRTAYGDEIKSMFYDVYTKKYWTVTPDEMSVSWIGNRLTEPDLDKMISGAEEKSEDDNYYASEMRYPKQGGFASFLASLTESSDIACGKEAVSIDPDSRSVTFTDGSTVTYDDLASSIPLPVMAEIVRGVPENVKQSATRLKWTNISIVSVALNKPYDSDYVWDYVYDEAISTSRINKPGMQSIRNVPAGKSSMQFEIYRRGKEKADAKEDVDSVIFALESLGIAGKEEILFTDHQQLPYANIIYYNGMEEDRDIVRRYMESRGIKLIGRFGRWEYLWSDQSYMSGIKAAGEG